MKKDIFKKMVVGFSIYFFCLVLMYGIVHTSINIVNNVGKVETPTFTFNINILVFIIYGLIGIFTLIVFLVLIYTLGDTFWKKIEYNRLKKW